MIKYLETTELDIGPPPVSESDTFLELGVRGRCTGRLEL
jgi:hypothetical protein